MRLRLALQKLYDSIAGSQSACEESACDRFSRFFIGPIYGIRIKEKAGKAIGDRHLESEGKAENAEGHFRSGVGKAMDAVREIVNSEKE